MYCLVPDVREVCLVGLVKLFLLSQENHKIIISPNREKPIPKTNTKSLISIFTSQVTMKFLFSGLAHQPSLRHEEETHKMKDILSNDTTIKEILPQVTRDDVTVKVAASGLERASCYEIRNKIFVKEQNFPYEWDVDGKDETAIHVLAYDCCTGRPMGTVRLLLDDDRVVTITRVSVLKEFRSLGVGRKLIEFCVEHMKSIRVPKAVMSAQTHATRFYESLGFNVPEGCEEYIYENIPHIDMEQAFVY